MSAMPMERLNEAIDSWISLSNPTGATLFWWSALAQWPIYGLPFLLGGLWLFGPRQARAAAVSAGLSACLALAVAALASQMIDHPRPFMVGLAGNLLDHAADSSFPSDHAAIFFALAAAFGLWPSRGLRWLGVAVAIAGLAVGWARVALGIHFPFDVLGSAVIGAAAAAVVVAGPLRRGAALLTAVGEAVRGRLPGLPFRDDPAPADLAGSDARSAR